METLKQLLIKRRNVVYVLKYSTATPFIWHMGKFKCFYCLEHIQDPDNLRLHTNSHVFTDLELLVHSRTKNNRAKDAAVKVDITNLCCKLCQNGVVFSKLEQFIHHLIISHDADYDMSIPNCLLPFKLDKEQQTCPSCDMKFVFFEYLLRHANKHHLSHAYMCDICGTSFQGENHLRMHTRYYHKEGGYECKYCGEVLQTLSKKILHEKNKHLVNLLQCPHCTQAFKSPYLKKQHLANVHGIEELKIKCPYCPKVFPQESIMSRHMRRVHLREKNVECGVCKEKFFSAYDVKLHMTRHNGERKFKCEYCGKDFAKKCNLNVHILTHTKGGRFACHICERKFYTEENLNKHLQNTHSLGLKPEFEQEHEQEGDTLGEMVDINTEVVQMEFIGNELDGAEIIEQYVQ